MKYRILVFSFVICIGCTNYTKDSHSLNKALNTINKSIANDEHLYLIQASFYCKGCVQSIYAQLDSLIPTGQEKNNITVISANNSDFPDHLESKVNFIKDSLKTIEQTLGNFVNVTIFETNNQKVVNKTNFNNTKQTRLPRYAKEFILR